MPPSGHRVPIAVLADPRPLGIQPHRPAVPDHMGRDRFLCGRVTACFSNFITGPYAREVSQRSATQRIAEVEAQTAKVYPEGVACAPTGPPLRPGHRALHRRRLLPVSARPGHEVLAPAAGADGRGRSHSLGRRTHRGAPGFMGSAIRSGQRVATAHRQSPPPRTNDSFTCGSPRPISATRISWARRQRDLVALWSPRPTSAIRTVGMGRAGWAYASGLWLS